MSLSKFTNVKMTAIATVVPEHEINIYDEAQYYGNSVKKIDRMRKMVGFYKRRTIDDNSTAADLGICAARKLIKNYEVDVSTIDALVNVTQTPDYSSPATAFFMHDKLGLSKGTPAFDINEGCPGFVYGMWVVSSLIQSGVCKRVLLICADMPSVGIPIDDRNSAPIFGDAGSAILCEYSKEAVDSYYNIEVQSDGFESIIGPSTGKRFLLSSKNIYDYINRLETIAADPLINEKGNEISFFSGYLDGLSVFDFTMNVVPKNIKELLEWANISKEDIGMLCLHQANKQIVQTISQAVGFEDERAPYSVFETYGNNTMCSVPSVICENLKEKSANEKVQILASGFGNGLSCASCILTLDHIYNGGITNYERPEYYKTMEEFIEYWKNKFRGVK